MFLTKLTFGGYIKPKKAAQVAIPSNRVNVSYLWATPSARQQRHALWRRNPRKSGQCFLLTQDDLAGLGQVRKRVAIPSNRVNVSYFVIVVFDKKDNVIACGSQSPQIGSMFLTFLKIGQGI